MQTQQQPAPPRGPKPPPALAPTAAPFVPRARPPAAPTTLHANAPSFHFPAAPATGPRAFQPRHPQLAPPPIRTVAPVPAPAQPASSPRMPAVSSAGSSPLARGPSPRPPAAMASISPRPASVSPQPPRRQPSISPRPSHAPSASFVPGHGYTPSQALNPAFPSGAPPSHNAADPNAAQRRGGPRPSYTPLKLAGHNSTPSVALDPAAFAASLVAATAPKPAAVDKSPEPAPKPIDDAKSTHSSNTINSSPLAAQNALHRSPVPPPAAALQPQPQTMSNGTAPPAAPMKKAPQYTPLKLSGHNTKPSVSLDPLAFAASLDMSRSTSTGEQDSRISTISEEVADRDVQVGTAPSQASPDAPAMVQSPDAMQATPAPASASSGGKPHHARTATVAPGAIQVTAANPNQSRKRYIVSLPQDGLLGSKLDAPGPANSAADAANSTGGSDLGDSTSAPATSSLSGSSTDDTTPDHRAAVQAAWRPRVPLDPQPDLGPLSSPSEALTSIEPAPIAMPIGLVEAAADASAAAAAARAMQPQNLQAVQAAADAEAAAESVAAEEAHEAALEAGLTTGHSSLFVYETLGLPETIDIFLPGQAAWGEYRAERSAALAAQAQFAAQIAQMTQMAQMGVSPNDMPPLPTGENALSVLAGVPPALPPQPPLAPGQRLLPPPVFEGPMNRPPPTTDESEDIEHSGPAQGQSTKLMPKWLASGWSRSPGRDSATSPTPSQETQDPSGGAPAPALLGPSHGGSPQPPAAPGTLTFLQRLSGAAKRASLSLTNSSMADKDSGRSLSRSPQPDETELKGTTPTGAGSMLSALGFGRSRSTSPQPGNANPGGHANVDGKSGQARPAWQSLGAGFGYDIPPVRSPSGLSAHAEEAEQSISKDDMEDVDMRTNPSEDGDTSSMAEGEYDRLERDFPTESVKPNVSASGPSGLGQGLPTTLAFNPGRTSSSSKYAPAAPRVPSNIQLNASAPSFTPGSRAPSASFTFVAPSAAPKMASPTQPTKVTANDDGEQGREKRFRGTKETTPTPTNAAARMSRRATGSHASTSIPPNLFAPPPSVPRKLEIRAPEPRPPVPPKSATPQQARSTAQTQTDALAGASAPSGLAQLFGSAVPVSGAVPTAQEAAVDTEEEDDPETAHRRRRSQAPSHSSERAAMAAKLSQVVRTATQRHAAHASSTSIGSRGGLGTPRRARLASDVASSVIAHDPVAAAVAAARAEAAEAEDIVEQIVSRLDASLDAWAHRILARVEAERAASLANAVPASPARPLPRRVDAFTTPTRSTMRGTPLAVAGSPLARPGQSFALSSPPPGSLSSPDSPEIMTRVEQGVRDTFSNYLKRLPGLGARGPAAAAPSKDAPASGKEGTQSEEAQDSLTDARGELDFDYVEEMLRAKVNDLEGEVLSIVKDGLTAATQAAAAEKAGERGTADNAVAVSMSSEEIGTLADILDERMRSTFDTAQVELLRVMAQPSPAVMSALGDTEAAINAHTASFLATQQSVEELLQSLPAKFDAATDTLAGAGHDVAKQVQASVVGALQPQLDGLRASSERIDGEVLSAQVIAALVPLLEGRHDELPDRIADAVAGHLRADLRTQVQMQMQAHLQAQAHDAEATRDAALRRLALPPPSVFAPSSAVSTAMSSPPPRRDRDSDSFDVASTTGATTVVDAPVQEEEHEADAGSDRPANVKEGRGQGQAQGRSMSTDRSSSSAGGQALTPEALAELAKVLATEMRVSGTLSLDPIVERLDPLVASQEKTWSVSKDLLAQQGELAGTLRALPASLGAKTDVFLAATRETHQTQKVILERLMNVADANHAAQMRISELEEAASKRADALAEALKAQARVTGELKEAKAELSATNKYMATLKEEVDDLETRLETAQTNATTATEQLRDAHSRLRDAVEARHAAERSSDEIRRRMAESEAEVARAQSAASLASSRAEDARAVLEREREDRTAERARAEAETADWRERAARAAQEAEEAHGRLSAYVEDAQKTRGKAAADVARAEAEAAKAEGALSVAQARTKELDAQNNDLVQALATQKQTAASVQQRSADSDRRLQAALTTSTELTSRVNQLENELNTARANEKRLCGEIEQLNTQFEAVEAEVGSMKEMLISKDAYEDARKDAELARREADTMRTERDDLRAQLDALRAEMMARTTAAASNTASTLNVSAAASPRHALREVQDENVAPHAAQAVAHKTPRAPALALDHAQPYDWSTSDPVQEDDDGWWS